MAKKIVSGIIAALLALSMFSVAFGTFIQYPYKTDMPVIFIESWTPTAGTVKVNVTIFHLTNRFYTTDQQWHPGEELGPYVAGQARYNYSLGNLYAFDINFTWNTGRLSYVSHSNRVGVETYPDGVLHEPVYPVEETVNPAGSYRLAYSSQNPAVAFNNPLTESTVFTFTFTDLGGAGDYGLNFNSIDLLIDLVGMPYVQPSIPYRTVLLHDVAVGGIKPNKKYVGAGQPFTINVTLQNQGDFDEIISTTDLYAGSTIIWSRISTSVGKRDIRLFSNTISTTGLAKGNYTLKSIISAVPGEYDTDDLTLIKGSFLVTLPGDVDGNKNVNIFDIVKMAGVYGKNYPNPKYDPVCDLDNNGMINIFDIVMAAGNYGKSWS